ncbi:MAG: hypothetical protein ACJ790_22070 [Myxococcaceae bacterium]
MTVRIDRKNSGTANAAARTDSKQPAAPAKRTSTSAENAFTGTASNAAEKLSPKAKSVSVSASPQALWGKIANDEDYAENFFAAAALQPGTRAEAIQAQMNEVQGQIGDRVNHLEGKWKHQRLDNRAQMLKQFADRNDISASDKTKIKTLVSKQDALQAKITQASAELKSEYPPKSPAQAAERKEKLRALVELRKEQRSLVYEAKAVVEKKPQENAVLLAQNEQKLDPTAPKDAPSLLSLIGKWLHLSSIFTFFNSFAADVRHKNAEQKREDIQVEVARLAQERRRRETEGLRKDDFRALQLGLKLS